MNKRLIKLRLLGVLSLGLFFLGGCSTDSDRVSGGSGEIKASFNADYTVKTSGKAEASKVNAIAPDISKFMVHLTKSDGSYDKTWTSIGEFPTDTKFTTGKYTMEISYGTLDKEGFDMPYYFGSGSVEVVDEETASPTITAKLANTMVTISYTDAFKQYFKDYSAKIKSTGGEYIAFAKDEARAAYVRPGNIAMELTLTKQDGTTFTFAPADIANAAAGTHYHVTFDINGGEVGDAVLTISFDDTTDVKPIVITLSDDLVNAPAPTITPTGYDSSTPVNVIAGNQPASKTSAMLMAISGLKSVTLTTESEYLLSKGWPAEIDLLQATAEQKALLQQYGLKVTGLWSNPDKMAIVDFTALIAKLQPLNGNSTHKFTLQLKDMFTRVCETPVTLTVNAPAVVFSLSDPASLEIGKTTASFNMIYNGTDIAGNLAFKAMDKYGVWVNCPVQAATATGTNTYKVTVTVPDMASAVSLKGIYRSLTESNTISIPRTTPSYSIAVADANVWTDKATVTLTPADASLTSALTGYATIYYKAGSGDYQKATSVTKDAANGTITLTGLSAATAYTVKCTLTDGTGNTTFSNEVAFTTETKLVLTNSDMETWTSNKLTESGSDLSGNSKVYWTKWFPRSSADIASDGWCTLNPTTMQYGGSPSTFLGLPTSPYVGCTYTTNPGTERTTDCAAGTYAALIRTVGWGKNNKADNSASENVTAGELYLGTYTLSSHTPNYGIAFASRPSALTFKYKYSPKNSADYGVATIVVKDASGTVIAEKSMNLTSQGSYTSATLSLSYTKLAKAASMYVVFKSSGNASCLTSNSTNLSYPSFGNLSNGEFVGSQLYIDDINLTY